MLSGNVFLYLFWFHISLFASNCSNLSKSENIFSFYETLLLACSTYAFLIFPFILEKLSFSNLINVCNFYFIYWPVIQVILLHSAETRHLYYVDWHYNKLTLLSISSNICYTMYAISRGTMPWDDELHLADTISANIS